MTVSRPPQLLALVTVLFATLVAIVVSGVAAPVPTAPRWHPKLLRSEPAANKVAPAAPTVIKLWFSERVELGISRIRLIDAKGATVGTGGTARIPGTGEAALQAPVTAPLPPGRYTVNWVTASNDGHAMKGSFAFTVGPGR